MKAASPAGFYYPPEWAPHRATWLSWPHNQDTWPGGIEPIFNGYLQFVQEICKHEQICLNVADHNMEQVVKGMLSSAGIPLSSVTFFHHATNDAWCRDHGPCFLVHPEGEKIVLNWDYNAWGEKYPPYDLDNAIPEKTARALGLESIRPGLVLEGGSVDFNGAGTLLTTTSCLLNPNRNPGLSREEIEGYLEKFLGGRADTLVGAWHCRR